ncbi:MAG: site-2 protease family protein [Candidatus Peribacteraceae bacterium]|jgi:Zn-dependent protease
MTPFLNPTFIIAILIALSVHEAAHAYIAKRLGDPTADMAGRVTLNPVAHLDPIGSLLFLFVGFGWGKPVPVNPANFRHPVRDNALVSLAGPLSNLLMAAVSFAGLALLARAVPGSVTGLLSPMPEASVGVQFAGSLLGGLLFINLALMAFNLLPIAPLDGSHVLEALIPYRYQDAYAEFMRRGPFVLLFLLVAERLIGFPFLSTWIEGIMGAAFSLLQVLFGWM